MKRKFLSLGLMFMLAVLNVMGVQGYAYNDNADYSVKIGDKTIPFEDYPAGSYFTDNGQPCNDHGNCRGGSFTNELACNCKCTWNGVALRSSSCCGFANMVFYRLFEHTTYSQTTNVVSGLSGEDMNLTYLYDLFTNGTVKAGAHIRTNSPAGGAQHSMIFMGCNDTHIYTYEGNCDGHCKVGVIERTWAEMVTYLKSKEGIAYIQMPQNYPETNNTEVEVNNHVYQVFDESMTWEEAKTYCESLGGYLATITSEEEQEKVSQVVLNGKKDSYWIGAKKNNNSMWEWITEENFDYSNWSKGEPNNSEGREIYLEIYNITAYGKQTNMGWNDAIIRWNGNYSVYHRGFVCEWNSQAEYEDAKDRIKVKVSDKYISFDQPPIIENDRTLVPLRAIFEALGATVEWDGETKTVSAFKEAMKLALKIGEKIMSVNGMDKVLDVAAKVINDRTLVPVRAISEAFGCSVEWDGDTKTVIIKTK